jgi:glycosyltransferase involved in cell wall biosynthesis
VSEVVRDVSVVMSVFNGERYLRSALESVLTQQGVDFELVVVDDGSVDGSSRILLDYAARDDRVRVLQQSNVGLTRALITGCAAARGRYIARQDADDLSMPGRLLLQKQMLDADPELTFVSSWAEVIGPEDEPLLTYRRPHGSQTATRLLLDGRTGPPGHGSVMMRADAYRRVGGYRERLYYAQDSDLWLRLSQVGCINYVQKVLYRYRLAADSISGSQHERKLAYANLIDRMHEARLRGEDDTEMLATADLPVSGKDGKAFRPSSDATNYFIGRLLVARRDPRAKLYLRNAVKAKPTDPRRILMSLIAECGAPFWRTGGVMPE